MTETTPEFLNKVHTQLLTAPDSQLSARLVEQTREFGARDPVPTDQEKYDCLVELSITSCCEASSFVKTLLDLRSFYERPGGPREDWPGMTLHRDVVT